MAHTRWTELETERARKLIADGVNEPEFKRLTGRTKEAAMSRLKYVDDPTYRERCIANASRNRTYYERTYVPRGPSKLPTQYAYEEPRPVAPPAVLEDAQKRAAAPKSLTGWICGDPCALQSALGKKMAGGATS